MTTKCVTAPLHASCVPSQRLDGVIGASIARRGYSPFASCLALVLTFFQVICTPLPNSHLHFVQSRSTGLKAHQTLPGNQRQQKRARCLPDCSESSVCTPKFLCNNLPLPSTFRAAAISCAGMQAAALPRMPAHVQTLPPGVQYMLPHLPSHCVRKGVRNGGGTLPPFAATPPAAPAQ